MIVKLTSGEGLHVELLESPADEVAIVIGATVKVGPHDCEGLHLVEADAAELHALVAGGFGRALAGLDALLKASGAGLWSVQDAATGQKRGKYRAHNASGAILACCGDGQGEDADLFAEPIDEGEN